MATITMTTEQTEIYDNGSEPAKRELMSELVAKAREMGGAEIHTADGIVTEVVAVEMSPTGRDAMQVIFDNGGGVTLQTDEFAHYYPDGGKRAAEDVQILLNGGATNDWDGNDPEVRLDPSQEQIRNGGYCVYDTADIREVLAAGEIDTSWVNVREFFGALGVRIVE